MMTLKIISQDRVDFRKTGKTFTTIQDMTARQVTFALAIGVQIFVTIKTLTAKAPTLFTIHLNRLIICAII